MQGKKGPTPINARGCETARTERQVQNLRRTVFLGMISRIEVFTLGEKYSCQFHILVHCGLMYFPIDSLYVSMQICSHRMSIRKYKSTELLQGTLDLLILKTLVHGELHGLAIAHRVEQITNGAFEVKAGSLFPALHSMEEAGWLA
jgi:hypothetical protein